jgi:4-diphosphocytidyl-2-C-methyl-D-erythritol kinase
MALLSLLDLPAPAKLNLFLHVVGRRDDGYHLLQSLFVLIDWADTLHVEVRQDGRLQRHDLAQALPADDLVLRAARALQQASGCALGADVSIEKRVPWGAGLGGGSSDAATTLLALNRLWGLHWPRSRLLALGATLGADVPFFVGGDNAFVEGIGDRLSPVDWPRRSYAVVKPPQPVSTAAIFTDPRLSRNSEPAILEGSLSGRKCGRKGSTDDWLARLVERGRNDLQPVAEALCPAIAQAVRWLDDGFGGGRPGDGRSSRMTGSGSAVFVDVGSADESADESADDSTDDSTAGSAAGNVADRDLPEGWVGRMCRSLDRHPLRDWAG